MDLNPSLSIIIIAGDEAAQIKDCLLSANFAPEIILVAANSHDRTKAISQKLIPRIKIITANDSPHRYFSKWRNLGRQSATSQWLFYLDADERISRSLRREILSVIARSSFSYYAVPRRNSFLGVHVRYGQSTKDYVKRLYFRRNFKGYRGILHEEPIVTGKLGLLSSPLIHLTHRDLSSMLSKTLIWTDMESDALLSANHPPIVSWRIMMMFLSKLYQRLIYQHGWRDGLVCWISAIFESFDTYIIYANLLEKQQS